MHEIVIATRGSALALWQANAVAAMLRGRYPSLDVRLEVITTTGDRNLETPLSTIGDKGLFTKELEAALLAGRAHCAVHSLKDMQTQLPGGLMLGAVARRHAAEDVLVAAPGGTLGSLPHGAVVATGSLRRTAQLRAMRPDLQIVDVRGNIGTRVEKYHANNWAGMLLARAGLERLGMEAEIAEVIDASVIVPAVGQGALGIECRADDAATLELLAAIEHEETRAATAAERAMLRVLEGGCQVPVGGHAVITDGVLRLDGVIASVDGTRLVRDAVQGSAADAESIGERLAARLLDAGGAAILEGIRG
ncbi:MAG TPA: hydroxymethylbilane synthase [Candidatus Kapabacteria bacterium]|nr:hydroxymethylbilane synthase [Candidatus Kapabacteria bacterium]